MNEPSPSDIEQLRDRWAHPRIAYGFEIDADTNAREVLRINDRWADTSHRPPQFNVVFPAGGVGALVPRHRRRSRLLVADSDVARRIGFATTLEHPPSLAQQRLQMKLVRTYLPREWSRGMSGDENPRYWLLNAGCVATRVVLAARFQAGDGDLERMIRAGAERLSSVECGVDIIRTKARHASIELPLRETALRAIAHIRRLLPHSEPRFRILLVPTKQSGVHSRR